MKEILAVLRPRKDRETKLALEKLGIFTCTTRRVYGRGRQRGLRYTVDPAALPAERVSMQYLPKKMLYIVVEDHQVSPAVRAMMKVNRTGQFGDGKIFVMDCGDAVRVRTGEKGGKALK
jgi:nitrogen regulatory protein PII 2